MTTIYRRGKANLVGGSNIYRCRPCLDRNVRIHIVARTPYVIRFNGGPPKPADTSEFIFLIAFAMSFTIIGLIFVAQYSLSTIETDEFGLSRRNTIGQISFSTKWNEIERLSVRHKQNFRYYSIHQVSGSHVRRNVKGRSELIETCRKNAPNLDFSTWGAPLRRKGFFH